MDNIKQAFKAVISVYYINIFISIFLKSMWVATYCKEKIVLDVKKAIKYVLSKHFIFNIVFLTFNTKEIIKH